jgi:hypothetical protein
VKVFEAQHRVTAGNARKIASLWPQVNARSYLGSTCSQSGCMTSSSLDPFSRGIRNCQQRANSKRPSNKGFVGEN